MKTLIAVLLIMAGVSVQEAVTGHKISEFPNESVPPSNHLFVLEDPGNTNYHMSFGQLTNKVSSIASNMATTLIASNLAIAISSNTVVQMTNTPDVFSYRETLQNFSKSSSGGFGDNFSGGGSQNTATAVGSLTAPFGADITPVSTYAYTAGNTEHMFGHLRWAVHSCGASINSTRIWAGLTSLAGTAVTTILATDTPGSTKTVAFRYSTTVPDTNWKFVVSDGTSATVVDTGVAFVVTNVFTMESKVPAAGTPITAYINGALVATVTTTIPTNGTKLYNLLGEQDQTGGNTNVFRSVQMRVLEQYGF